MPEVVVHMRGMAKRFGAVQALQDVSFELLAGEVHALLGENGAGKSTLVKILSGAYQPDAGEIRVENEPVSFRSPIQARQAGISIVHQEPELVPSTSIAENICLGSWPARRGVLRWNQMVREAERLAAMVGLRRPVTTAVERLSVAEQQMVQIARALFVASKVLILDEPTSSLTPQEKDALFQIVRALKAKGIGLILISHRLEEVFEIADRVTVLKDGRLVGTALMGEVDRFGLIRMMVGRQMGKLYPPKATQLGAELLVVERLGRKGAFADVSFTLHRGEVLGFAGLVGAGRTEVARAVFGAEPPDQGNMYLLGRAVRFRSPVEAIRHGVALVGEDRHQALISHLSVRENITLPSLADLARSGLLDRRLQTERAADMVERLRVRTPHVEHPVGALSGGNQQKVVFARWLLKNAEVFILDEPTRGIDVGAKEEIYQLVRQLAAGGKGVILISSELPEILGMSDRVLVMHQGRVSGVLDGDAATEERIAQLAVGVG